MAKKLLNMVFQGGGVRGSAYTGAISVCETEGYLVNQTAGTSAGAIMAALVAAGYTAYECKQILEDTDYNKFCDKWWTNNIPFIGSLITALWEDGLYKGKFFREWIAKLLQDKGITTFGDLKTKDGYKLHVIASDLSNSHGVVLPDDLEDMYGLDADKFPVADAIRASMSIPFFFKQYNIKDSLGRKVYFVDGGMSCMLPIYLFKNSGIKTVGFILRDLDKNKKYKEVTGPYDYICGLIDFISGGADYLYIEPEDWKNRIVVIDTFNISSTNFGITKQEKELLYMSGVNATSEFFEDHKQGLKDFKFSRAYKKKNFRR
jgi:NTE family protein